LRDPQQRFLFFSRTSIPEAEPICGIEPIQS